MKKLFLKHITSYTYLNPVVESSNKILLYPYNDINQQVVSHEIEISENPKIFTYLDNFNNSSKGESFLAFKSLITQRASDSNLNFFDLKNAM